MREALLHPKNFVVKTSSLSKPTDTSSVHEVKSCRPSTCRAFIWASRWRVAQLSRANSAVGGGNQKKTRAPGATWGGLSALQDSALHQKIQGYEDNDKEGIFCSCPTTQSPASMISNVWHRICCLLDLSSTHVLTWYQNGKNNLSIADWTWIQRVASFKFSAFIFYHNFLKFWFTIIITTHREIINFESFFMFKTHCSLYSFYYKTIL